MRSVKSGAAAISTRPASRSARCSATSSDSQPPMLDPTSTSLPVVKASIAASESSSQRPIVPSSKRPERSAHASSAIALVPVMSDRKPPRNTTVGERPSVFA